MIVLAPESPAESMSSSDVMNERIYFIPLAYRHCLRVRCQTVATGRRRGGGEDSYSYDIIPLSPSIVFGVGAANWIRHRGVVFPVRWRYYSERVRVAAALDSQSNSFFSRPTARRRHLWKDNRRFISVSLGGEFFFL